MKFFKNPSKADKTEAKTAAKSARATSKKTKKKKLVLSRLHLQRVTSLKRFSAVSFHPKHTTTKITKPRRTSSSQRLSSPANAPNSMMELRAHVKEKLQRQPSIKEPLRTSSSHRLWSPANPTNSMMKLIAQVREKLQRQPSIEEPLRTSSSHRLSSPANPTN